MKKFVFILLTFFMIVKGYAQPSKQSHDNDLYYTFELMCEAEDAKLSSVEVVPFNVVVGFGLPDGTKLLPEIENTFYYIKTIVVSMGATIPTGVMRILFTPNTGQGSEGSVFTRPTPQTAGGFSLYQDISCTSMEYTIGNHTAGDLSFLGTVYKITYKPN